MNINNNKRIHNSLNFQGNEPDQINEELNASAELLITNEDNELCKFNQPEQLDSVLKVTENALFWKPTGQVFLI